MTTRSLRLPSSQTHHGADRGGELVDDIGGHEWRVLIGGRLRRSHSGASYRTYNPATGEQIAEVPECGSEDVEIAVREAHEASRRWREIPVRERAAAVRRMAERVREFRDQFAYLDALDGGNPIRAMRSDMDQASDYMDAMADLASGLTGHTIPASTTHLHYTLLEPYGVVARINPYNHPLLFTAAKAVAPLLAGNAVVVKVPPQAPLSALWLGELIPDLFPDGCFNVLTGTTVDLGRALVRHPLVRRIAFTGSDATGLAIQREAASVAVKNVTLELGGKNALIALPDVSPKDIAKIAVRAMNLTSSAGQSCGSTSRILLHSSQRDEAVELMKYEFESIRVGNPVDDSTQMGPLVSKAQYDKVRRYIATGVGEGASLVSGGGRPPAIDNDAGFFVAPTILDDVTPDMRVAREEIFGPVVAVMEFEREREAVDTANAVRFGLTASLWTNDLGAAHRMAREVQAGYVWINDCAAHFFGTPFGGYKDSGVGREEGIEELRGYCLMKAVHVAVSG